MGHDMDEWKRKKVNRGVSILGGEKTGFESMFFLLFFTPGWGTIWFNAK